MCSRPVQAFFARLSPNKLWARGAASLLLFCVALGTASADTARLKASFSIVQPAQFSLQSTLEDESISLVTSAQCLSDSRQDESQANRCVDEYGSLARLSVRSLDSASLNIRALDSALAGFHFEPIWYLESPDHAQPGWISVNIGGRIELGEANILEDSVQPDIIQVAYAVEVVYQ